jgi:ADP-ribose pyrophosphatase
MKILQVTKLTDEKWVNLFAATFQNRDHVGRWVFASRKADPFEAGAPMDAVIIVPLLKDPGQPTRLVMIHEFRVPVGGYNHGFPAGLIEPFENIQDAIRREIHEETGLEVTAFQCITQGLYFSSGLSDENGAMAFVEVRIPPGGKQALEASEEIEVRLLDWDALNALCNDRSAKIDAKAWMVLYMYQRLGKLE